MVTFLRTDRNEPLKLEVNRTTEKFLGYYVSALESLHYISIDLKRMKYEDREKERMQKAKAGKPLTFKESEEVKKKAYSRIKLEDMFKPSKWSTGFIELFDEVKLPYFDISGKLRHSSPNSLLNEVYESLYSSHRDNGIFQFVFINRLEETMIAKGNALTKRSKSKDDYSNGFVREELKRLTNRMMEYFLSRTAILYSEYYKPGADNKSNISREYFSIFNKMKIPLLEPAFTEMEGSFQDPKYEIKKQYLKFGEAIDKKVSGLRYDLNIISYEEKEIPRLDELVWFNFAKEILQEMENKSKKET
ncbi:hypothetical protein M1585_02295 [Candidatus Parvarchaeota archaeon]|nr:hypothetical protein [Candidatus Parvarchaeota archaeon]